MGTETVEFPAGVRADGLPAALSDPARLAAVRATGLLDTGPEAAFDDLASLAAALTGCGRAFVTLVDERRSFWKACIGVDLHEVPDRQDPVRESFCYFLVGLGDTFAVEDAVNDPRTRDHPSVRPMNIGAWAGHPIFDGDGRVLGSLCVIDDRPHPWDPAVLASLATLARAVSTEISLRQSLAEAVAAQERSASLARSLQDSLLPPVLPQVPGLDAAASYLPAGGGTTVIGDFYDLFRGEGDQWHAVLGDVCGKGVEAAEVTALARYTVRAEASQHPAPATVLTRLNTALLAQRDDGRFLTAVHLTFRATPEGITGTLCLAGHPQPLLRHADGRVEPLGVLGTLLGARRTVTLTEVAFRLRPGDTLLLYTDGATEARAHRPGAPLFGEVGLTRALADCGGLTAEATIAHLHRNLDQHTGGWASDDTALLVVRVPPTTRST
ncbi:GAF domain-containing SpoIIE family protein phosphatase [Actinokineospora sp. NBRC 105648]|uniref:PP2C family protein-serine/threonine phosphatase n=1 Tax=Actinokineospora sp. NBRC 105648 TaxID=3032206 RepID=UPI00255665BE|nr:GAF domain-containing SpoIIE family protein phosphatase [Actinokineospora sp. NBRC 105648]